MRYSMTERDGGQRRRGRGQTATVRDPGRIGASGLIAVGASTTSTPGSMAEVYRREFTSGARVASGGWVEERPLAAGAFLHGLGRSSRR